MVQVTLTEMRDVAAGGTTERSATLEVPCRYVRRSMFSLTPGDRARFLEASQKMYQHTTEEGRELFGEGYVGAQDLWVRAHRIHHAPYTILATHTNKQCATSNNELATSD